MKITVSGPAAVYDADGQQVTAGAQLKKLDGACYDDDVCSHYFSDALDEMGVAGGNLRLVFDKHSKRLRVVSEFRAPRRLKPKELKTLIEETQAQWSDGIGEGCFDALGEQLGLTINVYPAADYDIHEVHAEQVDDGVKTAVKKQSPLLKAAEQGDVAKVRKLLAQGEPINAVDKYGHSVLQNAIHGEHTELALLLVRLGADLHQRTGDDGHSALHTAAMRGDGAVLRAMLDRGAEVNHRCKKKTTPLMWAANRDFLDAVRLLAESGADLNAQDKDGQTALMYTSKPEVAALLLSLGADPRVRDRHGRTAAEEARHQAEEWRSMKNTRRAEKYKKLAALLEAQEARVPHSPF